MVPPGTTNTLLTSERGKSPAILQQKWPKISGPKKSVI